MHPRETPGKGERGGSLLALGGPEVRGPYCEPSHVPLSSSAPPHLWPLTVHQRSSPCQAHPSPHNVEQGPQQRLLLVFNAMLGAERLHQWGNLVQVVSWHSGEEAGRAGGQSECNPRPKLSTSSTTQGGRQV